MRALANFSPNFRRSKFIRNCPLALSLAIAVVVACCAPATVVAWQESDIPERPPTEELLPETVVTFVQIDNYRDLAEKFRDSAGGQLMADESVAPLVEGLWKEARSAYDENARDEVGIDLDDLTSLPEGELVFAVIAPRRKNPEFFMLLELNNDNDQLNRVLDRTREVIEEESGEGIETETTDDGFKIEKFRADDRIVHYFRHEDTLVGCTSEEELNAFIDRWMGREVEKTRPLSTNRKFVTIMNRCLGTDELRPEARFFVDPITFAKSATRGNLAAQTTINFLPLLGLDGLLGVGGSMLLSEEEFESVAHFHMLLSNPKKGIFEMLAFKPTDYEPDSWLPASTNQYWTTSWDVPKLFDELRKIIDMIQGEGTVDEFFANNVNPELDIDFEQDVIGSIDGRVTFAQWMEPPAKLNSNVTTLAVKLKDLDKSKEVIDKFIERINRDAEEPNVVAFEYKGLTYWSEPEGRAEERMERMQEFRNRRFEERNDGQTRVTLDINAQSPGIALIGDSLVFASSVSFLKAAIDTEVGELPALRDDDNYREIADKMALMLDKELPSVIFYQNPEETMEMLMEVVKAENTREMIRQGAESSPRFAPFARQLEQNPLPEFDKIKKYFTKSGGYATSDETGYHFLFFNLKPNLDEE